MQKTHIAPEILQPFFESAANAAERGQSQYFTPYPFGRQIAGPLPAGRQDTASIRRFISRSIFAATRSHESHCSATAGNSGRSRHCPL